MKKSTLLSFVTAGAIVATSVGTYAAWDTLETATSEINLQYADGVVVGITTQPAAINEKLGGVNGKDEVSTDFVVNVAGLPSTGTKEMNLTAVDGSGAPITQSGLTFEFVKDGTSLTNGKDTSVEQSNAYTVKVKIDTDNTDKDTISAAVSKFKVKATLNYIPDAA